MRDGIVLFPFFAVWWITAYFGIAVFAMFLKEQWQFWFLAILVGMFQGGIQALSRSYFTKIIPAEKTGEYFGLMDICGKGASFLGTIVISLVSQLTGQVNIGVGAISLFFILGMIVFKMSTAEAGSM
ncbi:MFS transporter [Lachnospiraceae bacterium WCA3-601-WT-6H]|uniref:MFS transporter n=1 Tax=Waltera intestinalis TaxID=2606635 RepID=A0A6L5YHD2_9FIRM|nr:MFS transporter [Waltera intestinalis]